MEAWRVALLGVVCRLFFVSIVFFGVSRAGVFYLEGGRVWLVLGAVGWFRSLSLSLQSFALRCSARQPHRACAQAQHDGGPKEGFEMY